MRHDAETAGRAEHRQRDADADGVRDRAAESAYRAALGVATATLAAYDGGTASHSDDVVTLSLAIAQELEMEGRELTHLLAAAELHDIGKVAVPSEILEKPSALDDAEWKTVRRHTLTGHQILTAVPEMAEVAHIVRHCHERWDGQGYPDGRAGEDIPLASRIVFCADAFHAIRGDRPYRRGRSARLAMAEVKTHSGTQFDPTVVSALARVAERLREHRRLGLAWRGAGRRSHRLAALLLALAVGGSAYASTDGFHRWPRMGGGSEKPAQAARAAPPPVQQEEPPSSEPRPHGRDREPARKRKGGRHAGDGGATARHAAVPAPAQPQAAPSTSSPSAAPPAPDPVEDEAPEEEPVEEEDSSLEDEAAPQDDDDAAGEEVPAEPEAPVAEDPGFEQEAPAEADLPAGDEAPSGGQLDDE